MPNGKWGVHVIFQTDRIKNQELLLIRYFGKCRICEFRTYLINKSSWFFIRSVWKITCTPHLPFGNFYFLQKFLWEKIFINKVDKILFFKRFFEQISKSYFTKKFCHSDMFIAMSNRWQKWEGASWDPRGHPSKWVLFEFIVWTTFTK